MRINPTYKEHPDPELNGNPLTEALQPILHADEINRLINFTPDFSENFHDLPRIYKNLNIRRISEIFIASPITVTLYDKIFELILDGYRYRNPFTVKMTRFLYELAERNQLVSEDLGEKRVFEVIPPGMTTAPGSILSGPSGSGKTSTIRSILGIIPQVISHTAYGNIQSFQQDQIVWISFDAPSTPSTKALCLNFLKAVDEALDINRYFAEFSQKSDGTSVDLHILKVQEIAANHFIGLVHFDEMQFFLNYAKDKKAPNLQTLEAIFNKLGIPIIISTTNEGLPLINATEQSKRRMVSEMKFQLKPLKFGTDSFNEFIKAVFLPKVWGDEDVLNHQSVFIRKFYDLSAGLQAVMIRLARLHLYYSVQRGTSPFDEQQLEAVFNSQFHYMKDSLLSLRAGDTENFEKKVPRNKDGSVTWHNDNQESNNQAQEEASDTPPQPDKGAKKGRAKSPVKPVEAFHNPGLIGAI